MYAENNAFLVKVLLYIKVFHCGEPLLRNDIAIA